MGSYIGRSDLCYLCEINLIMRLLVAQTIFIPVRNPIVYTHSFQFLYITIIPHFKVDANTAVQWRLGVIDVDICNSGFDNLRENGFWLFRILRICYSHLDWMACIKPLSNCRGEGCMMRRWELEELICLSSMQVVDWNSPLGAWILRILRMCLCDMLIQEII